MEQTAENITKYLEEVSKLESSVYEQKRCYDYANNAVRLDAPSLPPLTMPQMEHAPAPIKAMHTEENVGGIVGSGICSFVFLVATVLGAVFGLVPLIVAGAILTLICAPLFISMLKALPNTRQANKEEDERYQAELIEQDRIEQENRKIYEEAMNAYHEQKKERQKQYEILYNEKVKVYDEARATVDLMYQSYESTKGALAQAYDYNVIFPKYRNMTAIFTILEYFQTGRCTELTGPNGAYNLYESELRQNIIINKLDTIIDKLDQIKNNQFLLYSEMQHVNHKLKEISRNTEDLLSETKRVEANTALTAYCSQITAANTAALTMIAALS